LAAVGRSCIGLSEASLLLEGLHGAQLRFKFEVFRRIAERWNRRQWKAQPFKGWILQRFLKAIDLLLDSIGDAIPGVGIITEFKEFFGEASGVEKWPHNPLPPSE
jgi:hypothetical protein